MGPKGEHVALSKDSKTNYSKQIVFGGTKKGKDYNTSHMQSMSKDSTCLVASHLEPFTT